MTTAAPIPEATFGKHTPAPPPADITVVLGSNYTVPAQTAQDGSSDLLKPGEAVCTNNRGPTATEGRNDISLDAVAIMHRVIRALEAKKAQDITILDLRGLTIIADYFIIATGTSAVNIRALVDGILEEARKEGIKGLRPEGMDDATWVLLDLGDVIVHVFDAEHRDFYQLERLWGDAPRLPIPEEVRHEQQNRLHPHTFLISYLIFVNSAQLKINRFRLD